MMNLQELIEQKTHAYAAIPLFQAIAEDRIPVQEFSHFFKEQFMTARFFQDIIWAVTDISSGPYAEFAKQHRHKDSGHYKWCKTDLERFGIEPMTDEDWFKLDWLPTRLYMSRILALCCEATPEERMLILMCMESAGEVTLGTLHDYIKRHGLQKQTVYLGEKHINIEEDQVENIKTVSKDLLQSSNKHYETIVDTIFDSLTKMFTKGGERYYAKHLQ